MSNPDPFKANQPPAANPQQSPQPIPAAPAQPQPIQPQPIQQQPIQQQPIQQPPMQPPQGVPTMMPHAAQTINPYASPTIEGGQWGQPQSGVSAQSVELLRETKPWVYLVSGVAIAGAAMMVIVGLIVLLYLPSRMGVQDDAASMAAGGIAYLLIGALQLTGAILLIRYGQAISGFLAYPATERLDSALSAQKSFWRFTGIVMLTGILLFIALIIAVAVFSASTARF